MSEKKNIVIKVKYPTPGQASDRPITSSPNVITQWNYKRIGLVLGGISIVVLSIFYFTGSKDSKNSTNTPLAIPLEEGTAVNKTQLTVGNNQPSKPKETTNNSIIRTQLTTDINKNEPIDTLKTPLKIGRNEKLGVYYFAELKGMKGKVIYHEWLLNGELVSRKKVNISADLWRTASKQTISYTMNNDWLVRLVDASGNKLGGKEFNLELK